jgi:preprotein translocase subunit SecE
MEAVTKKSDAMAADEEPERPQRPVVTAPPSGDGYFHIYKKGQGYWTRMGTVAGAALILLFADNFLWKQLQDQPSSGSLYKAFASVGMQAPHLAYLAILLFSAAYAFLAFHYMNKEPNVDFLIATDSEMKKVNWTTKKELIGSTKIVIGFMFVMAMLLLVYDLFFQTLFYLLGVLKTAPFFFKSH